MKSTCSKANCQVDGKKPIMIKAASSTITKPFRKRKATVELSFSEEDSDGDITSDVSSGMEDDMSDVDSLSSSVEENIPMDHALIKSC